MANYFKRVQEMTPTRFWINNVTREEAHLAIENGAMGCTQNPSYAWKMLSHGKEGQYAKKVMQQVLDTTVDDDEAVLALQRELVREIAKIFLPMYEKSYGKNGYVSIQGDPFKEDAESIVKYARFNREAGANIMAKIPVTEEGLKAIKILAAEGVPINATECMAVGQVLNVCKVYQEATKDLKNPAPIYFSLITGIFDEYMHNYVREQGIDIREDVLRQAGISVAKKVHALVKNAKYPCGFISGGARSLCHFTDMVGADAAVTINWVGTADRLLELDAPVTCNFMQQTPFAVEDELIEKLEDYRRAYFIHGIRPEEYENYGPVVLFRSSFEKAWVKAREEIKAARK